MYQDEFTSHTARASVPTKLVLAFSLDTRTVTPQSKEGRDHEEDHEESDEGEGGGEATENHSQGCDRSRAKGARRTAEGKFTKIIFNQIGGKECRRFAAMTWKERDAFMAKPENAVVQERYEKHLASVTA